MAQRLQKVDGQPNLFLDLDSGIYYVRVMIDGRDRWRSTRCTTLKQAIVAMRGILGELEKTRGTRVVEMPTLEAWWSTYREAKANTKGPQTWIREGFIMARVNAQFGKVRLNELSRSQLERYLNWRRHRAAEGTVTREHSLLHAVLEAAIDEGLLDRNPLRGVQRKAYATRQRVMTLEEQGKLERVLSPHLLRWMRFRLGTGVRCEELESIRLSTFDWDGRRFHVTGKGMRGVKKARWVPILPSEELALLEVVSSQLEENGERMRRGWKQYRGKEDVLWPFAPRSYRDALRKACREAGIEPFSPHVLRHTFATRYLLGGGDIYVLSQILGHAHVGVTERHYAHLRTQDLSARSADIRIGLVVGESVGKKIDRAK